MPIQSDFRRFAYIVVALGVALDFAVAIVPLGDIGYRLDGVVLVIGLLPYVVYLSFTDVVRGGWLVVAGVGILLLDIALRLPLRYLHYTGFTDNAIHYAPLLSTFVILPIALGIGVRRERRW